MKLIDILEVCSEYTSIQVFDLEDELISEYDRKNGISEYLNEKEVRQICVDNNILKIQVNEENYNKYIIENLIGTQLDIEDFDTIEEEWGAFYSDPNKYKYNKALIEAVRESLR